MLEGKEYNLDDCPNLQVFNDLVNFPHRRECLGIVIRGMSYAIKATNSI